MTRINTEHVFPPIPLRDFDWSASFDGYDRGDPGMKMLSFGQLRHNVPQARAVIDDFGDLVAVEAWR